MTSVYEIALMPVDNSSNITGIGYDVERQVLAVTFKSGDLWHYGGVPFELAEQFHAAESKGRFYAANIKSKFSAEKMTGPCPNCGDKGRVGTTCTDCGTALYEKEHRPT